MRNKIIAYTFEHPDGPHVILDDDTTRPITRIKYEEDGSPLGFIVKMAEDKWRVELCKDFKPLEIHHDHD